MLIDEKGATEASYAEECVIGSMLIDAECVPDVMQAVRGEDFADSTLRDIFAAIRALFLRREKIDPVMVLQELGAEEYRGKIAVLMRSTPTAANAMEYARIVREKRQLREIQDLCWPLNSSGMTLEAAREIVAQAAGLLIERQRDRDRSYSELISDFCARQNSAEPPDHLDWGIPALNEKLLLGPGRFVILGADSSVGKTALALQFALSIARKKRVGFFSYETPLPDAGDRLIANDADVSLSRSKAKRLTQQDWMQITEAGCRSDKLSLRVLECARYTVEDIRAKCIARGFEVIFVDYVQLIPTRRKERYEAVTEVSIDLHALAQELGITVVGLSQVTVPETDKKGNRRYISKDDLRESRQLKQDADVILLLDLSDPKDRYSNRVLQIEKNRDGPLGHLVLSFHPSRMRFEYVPPPENEEDAQRRERLAKMDANREERRRKAEAKARGGALDGQRSVFTEFGDTEGGDLPF